MSDLDKFLKDIGEEPADRAKPLDRPDAAAEPTRSAGKLDWQQRAGKGVAKSLAGTVTGIPRVINAGIGLASPSLRNTLGDLAEQIPGVKRMEDFAAEPSESWAETFGRLGGEGAQLLLGPGELKLGEKLAGKTLPGTFKAGEGFAAEEGARVAGKAASVKPGMDIPGKFVSNVGKASRGRKGFRGGKPFAFGRAAAGAPFIEKAGNAAEIAARGGVAGAVADPSNPGAGFALGAGTAGLAPLAGQFLRSGAGQYIAGHAPRYAAAAAVTGLGHTLGIPAHWLWTVGLPALVERWHSPVAQKIARGGKKAADYAGRALQVDPRVTGGLTGAGADAMKRMRRKHEYHDEPVAPEPTEEPEDAR